MPRPLPSYWIRRLSTRRKNEHVLFRQSRVEAESKSNRNVIAALASTRSRIIVPEALMDFELQLRRAYTLQQGRTI